MKNLPRISLVLAFAGFCACGLVAQAAPPAGPPVPKILVIDSNGILARSSAGQDMMRQLKAYRDQEEKDLRAQAQSLQAQARQLQQQAAILSADLRAKKAHELDARQESLKTIFGKRDAYIQGGFIKARGTLSAAVGPILRQIMLEHGANMILDKGVVLDSTLNIDVTSEVVQRLNQKMSTIKVELAPPPPGMQAAQ